MAAGVMFVTLLAAGCGTLLLWAQKIQAEKEALQAQQEKIQAEQEKELAQRQQVLADEEKKLAQRAKDLTEKESALAKKDARVRKQLQQVKDYLAFTETFLANRPHLEQEERKLAEQALQVCKELAQEQSDDPHIRVEIGSAYRRVGDLQQRLGRRAEAEAAYGRAIVLLGKLADQFPEAVHSRHELA